MKKLAAVFLTLSVLVVFSAAAFAECGKKGCCKSASAASKDPTAQDVVIDPACGMDVAVKDAKFSYKYKGKTYYFCSKKCKQNFVKDPSKFIGKENKETKEPK